MYIQITTLCNMSCAHCCFGCAPDKPFDHMSREVYKKAIALSADYESSISLGGGEPTLHPNFWEFFGEALAADTEYVWLATNGSKTNIAKALANLSGDKFGCCLSQDEYHDEIDESVIDAFEQNSCEIRTVSILFNQGSALENNIGDSDQCACSTIHINPLGVITMCGCTDSLVLGTVDNIDENVLTRGVEIISEYGCGLDLDLELINYVLDGIELTN